MGPEGQLKTLLFDIPNDKHIWLDFIPPPISTHAFLHAHRATLVSAIHGCITNHPKIEWLQTKFISVGHRFMVKEFGQGSVGMAYLCLCGTG